jgi:hypothetical protein
LSVQIMCLFSKDFRKENMLATNDALTASLDLLCIEMAVANDEAVLDHRLPAARVTDTAIRSRNRDYSGLRSPSRLLKKSVARPDSA